MLIRFKFFSFNLKSRSNVSFMNEILTKQRHDSLWIEDCNKNKAVSVTVILCIFCASTVIAPLQKNVTLISSKFEASCGLPELSRCAQCNDDKNGMPTIIWWISFRKTQHKLSIFSLTELHSAVIAQIVALGCEGVWEDPEVLAVNHLNWYQLPGLALESRPGASCRLLISQLYCHLVINTALLPGATASRGLDTRDWPGNVSLLLDVTL